MRTIKVRTLLTVSIVLSTVPIIAMLLLLFSYSISLTRRQETDLISGISQSITTSLTDNLSDIETKSSGLSHEMDYLVFCNSSARKRLSLSAPSVVSKLSEQLFIHSEVLGIFLYNTAADYFYPYYQINPEPHTNTMIRQLADSAQLSDTWSLHTVNGHPCLFYSQRSRYGNLLICVDPEYNDNFRSVASNASPGTEWSFGQPDAPPAGADLQSGAEEFYEIGSLPLALIHHRADNRLLFGIDRLQTVMLFVIILLILAVPGVYLMLQHVFLNPISQLSTSIQEINAGNIDCRTDVSTRIEELKVFSDNFNESLDKIQDLNKELYQHQLDVAMARLQYLQLQIRPHFFLNCLNNMYSLLDLRDYDGIRRMILAFSSHISYSFRDVKNFVALGDELTACQNYVNLCNITSTKSELEFDIDGRCVDANCLPLSVLTFVENCIKHCRPKQTLRISIGVYLLPAEDGSRLKITVRDNGGGFPAQALEELNATDPSNIQYRHTRIGISNVCYRLWLIYREDAKVTFYNEGADAVVELLLPYDTRKFTNSKETVNTRGIPS